MELCCCCGTATPDKEMRMVTADQTFPLSIDGRSCQVNEGEWLNICPECDARMREHGLVK